MVVEHGLRQERYLAPQVSYSIGSFVSWLTMSRLLVISWLGTAAIALRYY